MACRGVDMFQEKVLGQGPQDNESAIEQAKDEQISDCKLQSQALGKGARENGSREMLTRGGDIVIRGQYKSTTGSEFPVKDK